MLSDETVNKSQEKLPTKQVSSQNKPQYYNIQNSLFLLLVGNATKKNRGDSGVKKGMTCWILNLTYCFEVFS